MDPTQANSDGTPMPPRWQPPTVQRPQQPQAFVAPRPQVFQPTPTQPSAQPEIVVVPQPVLVPMQPSVPTVIVSPAVQSITAPELQLPEEAMAAQLPTAAELTEPVRPDVTAPVQTPVALPTPSFYPAPGQIAATPQPLPKAVPTARAKLLARVPRPNFKKYHKQIALAGCLVLVVGVVFGCLKASAYAEANHKVAVSNARNSTRTADLSALQNSIDIYFTKHGDYPTFNDLNSANFRSQNLSSLSVSALRDPFADSATLAAIPTKHSYSYRVLPAGCNDVQLKCNEYELAAVLDNGHTIAKMNP
jgi:hypothetical protein